MDKQPLAAAAASSSHDLAQRLYDKNIELENKRRKSAQARVPSDPNAWHQMRENFETIILEDHTFSEKHAIEFALWQLHYRRIEEFRAHYSAASHPRGGPARASKIRLQFKTFLSEATGFYHDLILKIRAKYGLPIGQFYPEQDDHQNKDGKKSIQIKKGLISCHRCLIYLGDLARYKGLYGEGESKSRDYAAASSYYLQAASLWPSSGNPHHQLAILATYSGDELMAVYRYFRSLAAEHPFSTARDNLIVAFEKNRQSHTQLHADSNGSVKELPVRTKGRGRGKVDSVARSKEPVTDTDVDIAAVTRQTFKAFRVCFVRLNGILFTHTSLEAFEEILSLVINALQELLSFGPEDEPCFGADADENGLFIVILVSILIFTVNNVRGGTEGLSYADIVQNTVLLKNALTTFYEVIGQLLKRCIELNDPSSSFLLPGILVCVEWIACHCDVVISKETDEKLTAQTNFWGYCVSLFNKLLSAGLVSYDDDEDLSCFTDMTQYEEGENEYQSALWEDFELRGFLPLEPAHMFLDFSRKHSDNKKDKLARVKRILTAGKVIVDKITIDNKKVRFDSKLNKFVIGVEMKDTGSSKLQVVKQLKVDSHVEGEGEGEDEDEVIVFKPNLIDNRAESLSLKEGFENLQNIDVGSSQSIIHQLDTVYASSQSLLPVNNYTQQPVNSSYSTQNIGQPVNSSCNTQNVGQPVNSSYNTKNIGQAVNSSYNTQNIGQPYQFQSSMWSGGLQGLTLMENGQPEMHREMQISNAAVGMMYTGPSHTPEPDPYLVGRNTSLNMPTSSLKVSTNRPIRHLGPPPGFTSVRPNKQVSESNSALGQNQNLLNDDYSWLDGYQLQSSMRSGVQPVNLPSNRSSQYVNDSVATSSFPFSGRQVPVVRFEGETQKNLESSHAHHQQQYVTQLDQQGQPVWKANHFV